MTAPPRRSDRVVPTKPRDARPWALAALVGGPVYVVAGLAPSVRMSAVATNVLLSTGLLITTACLIGLHLRYRPSYGALGLVGVLATGLGQVVQAASAAGSAAGESSRNGWVTGTFVAGSLLFLPGLVILTVAVLRSGTAPRWLGFVLLGPVGER